MLQKFLTDALLQRLKNVLRGIEANLSLSLFSGDIVFTNAELDLDKIKLPRVRFEEGLIGELRISVPWTALQQRPVKVTLRNLRLCIVLYEADDMMPPVPEALTSASSPTNLPAADTSNSESEGRGEWLADLLARTLLNMHVDIDGVFIRFEYRQRTHTDRFDLSLQRLECFTTESSDAIEPSSAMVSLIHLSVFLSLSLMLPLS